MRYISTIILTVLIILLAAVSFLHSQYNDYSFSLTFIPKAEKGEIESQRYIQFTDNSGSLLFGYRHQIKNVEMEQPRMSLQFKSKTESQILAAKTKPKEGKEQEYTFGFLKWTTGERSSDFYGSYTYIKFWVIELGLILLSTLFALTFFPPLKRKADPTRAVTTSSDT